MHFLISIDGDRCTTNSNYPVICICEFLTASKMDIKFICLHIISYQNSFLINSSLGNFYLVREIIISFIYDNVHFACMLPAL